MPYLKSKTLFSKPHLLLFLLAFGVIGIVIYLSLAAPNPNLSGDLNNDNKVDITDLSILLTNYGSSSSAALAAADINGDGAVNILDLSILLSHYGQSYSGGSFTPINTRRIGSLNYNQSNYGSWSNLNQYEYLITNSSLDSVTASQTAIAAQPGISLTYAYPIGSTPAYNESVPYSQALANGWLALNAAGQPIQETGAGSSYLMLVGNTSYQQEFIKNLLADAALVPGLKGFFFDDVIGDYTAFTGGAYTAVAYPTRASWQAALVSLLTATSNALHAHGLYLVANAAGYVEDHPGIDTGTFYQGWFTSVIQSGVNAVAYEYWMQSAGNFDLVRNGGTATFPAYWSGFVAAQEAVQNAGGDFIGLTNINAGSSPNLSVERYAKASFLMGWNGHLGAQIMTVVPTANNSAYNALSDPWNANWTAEIGTPTAARSQIASEVWYRSFTGGWVVINTNTAGGSSWTGTINGSSYTVPAADALIHSGP